MQTITIKSHKSNRTAQTLSIKDGTAIHRYSKEIPSFSKMVRLLNK